MPVKATVAYFNNNIGETKMESLKQNVMVEGYGGKSRNITFRVTKVLKTTTECVSFLNEQFVTRQLDNFVTDQTSVIAMMNQIKAYFGTDYLSEQLLDNRIRVIVSKPEERNPEIFEFFVEKVITEKVNLMTEAYKRS